jgi:hypothetical protein
MRERGGDSAMRDAETTALRYTNSELRESPE